MGRTSDRFPQAAAAEEGVGTRLHPDSAVEAAGGGPVAAGVTAAAADQGIRMEEFMNLLEEMRPTGEGPAAAADDLEPEQEVDISQVATLQPELAAGVGQQPSGTPVRTQAGPVISKPPPTAKLSTVLRNVALPPAPGEPEPAERAPTQPPMGPLPTKAPPVPLLTKAPPGRDPSSCRRRRRPRRS